MADLWKGKHDGASNIQITSQMIQDIQTISFKGKLVYSNQQNAKDTLYKLIGKSSAYILDMQNLEFIDSTGFGVLINLAKRLRGESPRTVILISDQMIRQLFIIAKFQLIFPIVGTQEEALLILKEGYQSPLHIDQY